MMRSRILVMTPRLCNSDPGGKMHLCFPALVGQKIDIPVKISHGFNRAFYKHAFRLPRVLYSRETVSPRVLDVEDSNGQIGRRQILSR